MVVAGGMESMTRAPYMLPKARGGMRMGHGEVLDHMFTDGLQDPDEGFMMGVYGQRCADKYDFTREADGRLWPRLGGTRPGAPWTASSMLRLRR